MKKIAVLIPAFDEAKIIAKTLKSILNLIPNEDIFVVDDGSSDSTARVARKFTKNVITTSNHGKAHALNFGIDHFKLTKNYKFLFFVDADTQPDANFLNKTMPHFDNEARKKIICVVGQVKSFGSNWISKYRQWEYFISHFIHKRAQENLHCILVTPGCATVYRSKIFNKLRFPTGTMTEDMDFTFLMHRSGLNNILFENKAIVYTEDPQNLFDFVKQIKRWYTGFWQVVRKHDIPWQGQFLDLEVTMLALEGIYNGLIVIFILLSLFPLFIFGGLNIYLIPFMIDLFVFFIPTLIWSSIADKDYKRILYLPSFYLLRFLSSLIFLRSFFTGYLSSEQEYVWNSKRYIQERRNL